MTRSLHNLVSIGDVLTAAHALVRDCTLEWGLEADNCRDGMQYVSGINDLCERLMDMADKRAEEQRKAAEEAMKKAGSERGGEECKNGGA